MTNTWTHRDALRLSHPVGLDEHIASFVLGKPSIRTRILRPDDLIAGFHTMQSAASVEDVLDTLNDYNNLPWETIPTQYLNDSRVWKALFYNGQLRGQALLRNIGRLVKIDAFSDMRFARDVAKVLISAEHITSTRLHPMNYLNAMSAGANSMIHQALDRGFEMSFGNIVPANKRTMVGVDISGSMTWNTFGNHSCAYLAAAMAMIIIRTEPMHQVFGFNTEFVDLGISAIDSLTDVHRKMYGENYMFGGTDCAVPMLHALKHNIEVDTFVVLTDNETWAGRVHPHQALQQYRKATGIPARLAVFAIEGGSFSIADPNDKGMMDFVGMDASSVQLFTDFSAGRI